MPSKKIIYNISKQDKKINNNIVTLMLQEVF